MAVRHVTSQLISLDGVFCSSFLVAISVLASPSSRTSIILYHGSGSSGGSGERFRSEQLADSGGTRPEAAAVCHQAERISRSSRSPVRICREEDGGPAAHRGSRCLQRRGIAKHLAKAAMDFVVEEDLKAHLTCWYIQKYVKENPQPQ
uniref:Protein NATD1 n=1 Tax=Labrus bergylta TaxID=56723 RepID=A0A3Q3GJ17_9LABR